MNQDEQKCLSYADRNLDFFPTVLSARYDGTPEYSMIRMNRICCLSGSAIPASCSFPIRDRDQLSFPFPFLIDVLMPVPV